MELWNKSLNNFGVQSVNAVTGSRINFKGHRSWIHWHQLSARHGFPCEHRPLVYAEFHQLLRVTLKRSQAEVQWRISLLPTLGRPSPMWRASTPPSLPQTSSKSRNRRIVRIASRLTPYLFSATLVGFPLAPSLKVSPWACRTPAKCRRWQSRLTTVTPISSSISPVFFHPLFSSKTGGVEQQRGEHSQKLWKSWNFRSSTLVL